MNTQLSHIQVADAISPKNPTTAIATKKNAQWVPLGPRSFLALGKGFGWGWGWGWVLRTASASISRSSALVFAGVGFRGLMSE
jgi:hypothetical protein